MVREEREEEPWPLLRGLRTEMVLTMGFETDLPHFGQPSWMSNVAKPHFKHRTKSPPRIRAANLQ